MAAPGTNPALLLREKVGGTLFASYPPEKLFLRRSCHGKPTYRMLSNLIPPPLKKPGSQFRNIN